MKSKKKITEEIVIELYDSAIVAMLTEEEARAAVETIMRDWDEEVKEQIGRIKRGG